MLNSQRVIETLVNISDRWIVGTRAYCQSFVVHNLLLVAIHRLQYIIIAIC